MSREIDPRQNNPLDIKQHAKDSVVKVVKDYLEKMGDETMSVSEAQIEAFEKTIGALPEGFLKNAASKLKPVQRFTSKINEGVATIQDTTWKIAKPIIAIELPFVRVIPDKPFSKTAIKTSRLGGNVGEKVVTGAVNATEKVKSKFKKTPKEE